MDMFKVTFIAVSKVIVSVMVGVVSTNSIPNGATTLRDFGFLISTILLPSLTMYNTAKSVNLDLLVRCGILIAFSIMLILSGLLWGVVLSVLLFRLDPKYSGIPAELRKNIRLDLFYDDAELAEESAAGQTQPGKGGNQKKKVSVPYVAVVVSERLRAVAVEGRELVNLMGIPDRKLEDYAGYRYATWVGCATQNGVTLPLSLLLNIAEVLPFIDGEQCAAYTFLFSISYSMFLWSACPYFVEQGQKAANKQRLIREVLTKHQQMITRCDAATQTLSLPVSQLLLQGKDTGAVVTGDREAARPPCIDKENEGNPLVHTRQLPAATLSSRSLSNCSAGTVEGRDDASPSSARSRQRRLSTFSSATTTSLQNSFTQTELVVPLVAAKDSQPGAAVVMTVPSSPSAMSPTSAAEFAYTMATVERFPYDWEAAGYIRIRYESEIQLQGRRSLVRRVREFSQSAWKLFCKLMMSPPFLSVVLGLLIGVIAPLHNFFFNGPLVMVMDAMSLLGQGSIPASLLVLGANLKGSTTAAGGGAAIPARKQQHQVGLNTALPLSPEERTLLGEEGFCYPWPDPQDGAEGGNTDGSDPCRAVRQGPPPALKSPEGSCIVATEDWAEDEEEPERPPVKGRGGVLLDNVKNALSLNGIRPTFVWGIIIFRLLVAPAFCFCFLVFLVNAMPFLFGGQDHLDKTLIVVLMVELAAPTAINSALVFNARQFMSYPWSKMLFFQYIMCALTMVMWATLGLNYVSSLE